MSGTTKNSSRRDNIFLPSILNAEKILMIKTHIFQDSTRNILYKFKRQLFAHLWLWFEHWSRYKSSNSDQEGTKFW